MRTPIWPQVLIVATSIYFTVNALAQAPADESIVAAPERDEGNPTLQANDYTRPSPRGDYTVRYSSQDNSVLGFDFENNGPNRVIPVARASIGSGPTRAFSFRFDDRARQNIMLMVTDIPNEFLSHMMESYFYFFPRKVLPALQWSTDPNEKSFRVVLPTEEEVIFDSETREVLRGVFEEGKPIDLGPDRFKRKFADLKYTGTGTVIRVDKRGADPRLGTTATISQGSKTCKVPSSKLFDQSLTGNAHFLFPTDEGFNEFLKKTCKFSIL